MVNRIRIKRTNHSLSSKIVSGKIFSQHVDDSRKKINEKKKSFDSMFDRKA